MFLTSLTKSKIRKVIADVFSANVMGFWGLGWFHFFGVTVCSPGRENFFQIRDGEKVLEILPERFVFGSWIAENTTRGHFWGTSDF